MADEAFNNQRPAIIVAIILAALTAAGLWYFFVFRSGDLPETAQETPTATADAGAQVAMDSTPSPTLDGRIAAVTTPAPAEPITATAPTGPTEAVVGGAATLAAIGLLGLRKVTRSRPV